MRPGLAAAALALTLSGCFFWDHGCSTSDRALTWRQPELWEWQPASGVPEVSDFIVTGSEWPTPPADWTGNNSIRAIGLDLDPRHHLLASNIRENISISAFLPQKMSASEREDTIRTFAQEATDLPAADREAVIRSMLDVHDGCDSTGCFFVGWGPEGELAIDRMAEGKTWDATPVEPGSWELTSGAWTVHANLDVRTFRGPWPEEMAIDSGGFVRGPYFRAGLSAAELEANTTRVMRAWGMPTPAYEHTGNLEQQVCA